jgi:hypothetical protein
MTSTNIAPHCPLHVGVVMQPVETKRPNWVPVWKEEAAKGPRKIWKCPVLGCPRVMVRELTDEELAAKKKQILCPKCGKPTDASATMRINGNNRCRECHKQARRLRRESMWLRARKRGRWARVPHVRQRETA